MRGRVIDTFPEQIGAVDLPEAETRLMAKTMRMGAAGSRLSKNARPGRD